MDRIVIGITFIVLALMLSPASAFDDGKNDVMCLAIYKTAFEQYVAELEAIKTSDDVDADKLGRAIIVQIHLDHYSGRIQLLRWVLNQDPTLYNKTVSKNFLERYTKELNTATALLHYDRCEHRVFEIYQAWREWRAQN